MRVDVRGLDKILVAVKELQEVDKNKAIKTGIRRALGIIRNRGKANLKAKKGKYSTGNLIKSIGVKIKRNKLGGLSGFNRSGSHAHLVDLGTKRRTTKQGLNRGKMPANYFWNSAINESSDKAVNTLFESIENAVTKIINRNANKV